MLQCSIKQVSAKVTLYKSGLPATTCHFYGEVIMSNTMMTKMNKWLQLALLVGGILGISWVVASLTTPGDWYASLDKPPLVPPSWAFGVVWPILYVLMAVAFWRILQHPEWQGYRKARNLFVVQLAVNYAWSFLFFMFHWPVVSALWLAMLVVLIVLTYRAFSRLDKIAGNLLLPYLAWCCFALYLNAGIAYLNPNA
jgi:translocator protein